MNKLLCFWAPLPIPESQRLIAAHRAPLRSLKSKNSPLTHTPTCMDTSMPSYYSTHPLSHTNTSFCPLPFPNPSCWPVLKNISSNSFGSKAISCVLQPPHLQIPTHGNTEGCLCAAGCYFYPHYGGQSQGEGRTQAAEAFQWHERLQAWAYAEWHVNVKTNAHHRIDIDTHLHTLFAAECSRGSWNVNRLLSKVLYSIGLLTHHCYKSI